MGIEGAEKLAGIDRPIELAGTPAKLDNVSRQATAQAQRPVSAVAPTLKFEM